MTGNWSPDLLDSSVKVWHHFSTPTAQWALYEASGLFGRSVTIQQGEGATNTFTHNYSMEE